jgi:sRNA-binding protein
MARHATRTHNEKILAILADWWERWPAAFAKPVPLALGITRQISAAFQGEAPRKLRGAALHRWTNQAAYLSAVARAEARRNLDGTEAGIPDDATREHARNLLAERAARYSEQRSSVAAQSLKTHPGMSDTPG